jgi:hypothetical protein
MQGRRVYANEDGFLPPLQPGDYGIHDGKWYGKTPNGYTCGLANHQVTEHENGTITVSPSILVSTDVEVWHGYLINGVWQSC